MNPEQLIEQFGYLAVLVGTLLEGEVVLVLAGFAAHEGHLRIPIVIAVAILGGFLGDEIFFIIGRRKGRSVLERRPKWKEHADRAGRWIERHPDLVAFGSRFVYGFRIVLPIAIGTTKVPALRFAAFNLAGACAWGILVGSAGYLFGHAFETLLREVEHVELLVFAGALGLAIVAWLVFRHRRRRASGSG